MEFTTVRRENKIIEDTRKRCKKRVSAKPYRMKRHIQKHHAKINCPPRTANPTSSTDVPVPSTVLLCHPHLQQLKVAIFRIIKQVFYPMDKSY